MSELGHALAASKAAERARSIRALLRTPLITTRTDASALAEINRHRDWLVRWFAESAGWKLVVDPGAGFARLHKVVAGPDGTRPAVVRGDRPPFDRRRYALLCLVLAALDDAPGQATLRSLVQAVRELSADERGITPFDPDQQSERRAFVDAILWLVAAGVIVERDGNTARYADSTEGDALYDVDDRLLGQLVSTPVPPALAGSADRMMVETHAETEEGRNRAARQRVFRILLDDPVLYVEDLDEDETAWLSQARGLVYERLGEAGFVTEKRAEGLAAIDPAGTASDLRFPDGDSAVKHAALLLCEYFTGRVREGRGPRISTADLLATVALLIDTYGQRCGWRADYLDAEHGSRRLQRDACELLASLRLLRAVPEGWEARPAIARFAPASVSS
ncbi:MAG: TIGR02678 family protein [Myxococcota bacterium]